MRINISKKTIIIISSVVLSVLAAVCAVLIILKSTPTVLVNNDNASSIVSSVVETSSQEKTDNGIRLMISNPSSNSISTTTSVFAFSGTSDPNESLTLNGNEVAREANGIFTIEVNLNVGKNTFTFCHKNETYTYTVNYRYVIIESYSPASSQIFSSGSTLTVSANARKGSTVTASLNGNTINLNPDIKADDTSDFVSYYGTFNLPGNNFSDLDLGNITFKGNHSGVTETFYSGKITCKKPDILVDYDPNATPLGGKYINVGSGKITEIIAHEAETFDAYSTNDWSKTTNNYLPKGTVDYSAQGYVYYTSKNEKKKYSVLRCGKQVYTEKNDKPVANNVPVIHEYIGTLPQYNQVNIASFENNGNHTVLTLDCAWKAPFYFDILPQKYNNGDRYYNIDTPTFNYIDITFCYANELSGQIIIPEDNPIFSSANIIQNQSDYTLRLHLKKQGGFYGWTCYYDQSDRLCFEFLNPVQTVSAQNKYGIDLTGVDILIDVGHGGKDPGAIGFNKTNTEAERNLNLAYILKSELEGIGATVHMTRTSDTTSSSETKLQLIKQIKPDYCIAIHHNSSNKASPNGYDTRYFTPFSKKAAEYIYNYTYNTNLYNKSLFGWHQYFMLRSTVCPVVLTENGYMSNINDFNNMLNQSYNIIKAEAMVKGIAEYFSAIRF